MTSVIEVLGVDPAFANFGMVSASVCIFSGDVVVNEMLLLKTEASTSKTIRKSSDDLRRAGELIEGFHSMAEGKSVVISEIPFGSQSARASWSLGISLGVLASSKIPVIQVTPNEAKMSSVGVKTASKLDMINWAMLKHGEVTWKLRKTTEGFKPTLDNEHLADALASIYAGIRTDQFKQLVSVVRSFRKDKVSKR